MTQNDSPVIDVRGLTHSYGKRVVLRDLSLQVPKGALYALFGDNGAGKSTLMQLLTRLQRVQAGTLSIFGTDVRQLTVEQRQRISYVAEGQQLPGWMRLSQLERYCAPLYPQWDESLVASLRDRFELDSHQRIDTMSRGERMKVALLCALAPRPSLLIMDEPFTGMDVITKDELVRGLLDSVQDDAWTILLCSHDIAEVEMLADWVGFLRDGRVNVSAPLEALRARYKRVELSGVRAEDVPSELPTGWLSVQRAAGMLSFVLAEDAQKNDTVASLAIGGSSIVEVREVSLRELYIALASKRHARATT